MKKKDRASSAALRGSPNCTQPLSGQPPKTQIASFPTFPLAELLGELGRRIDEARERARAHSRGHRSSQAAKQYAKSGALDDLRQWLLVRVPQAEKSGNAPHE
jgi:hypothetical protein